ncbi:MAG: TIGR00269 family protein [Candidatus Thorarchaeota archaeon]
MLKINQDNEYFQISTRLGRCDYCHTNKLIIHRKYSGEKLCNECFIKSIERNISSTISKYKMLKPQDLVVIATSGGKDSSTLLYNLYSIQKSHYKSKKLIALTIDEGISGYRDKSIKFAKEFCNEYHIEHKILTFKEVVGKSLDEIISLKKDTPEYQYACNYCATLRRRILNEGARQLGADKLAMGHNLTDIAETYLMNILFKRHSIIANQYPFKQENKDIQKFYIKKITPLMRIPEEEIFLYANLKHFKYYPSHCPYRDQDPILRKRVLEFIQKCKTLSPEIEFNLLNGFLEISEILYKYNPKKSYNICKKCGYPCGKNVCLYCHYLAEFNI